MSHQFSVPCALGPQHRAPEPVPSLETHPKSEPNGWANGWRSVGRKKKHDWHPMADKSECKFWHEMLKIASVSGAPPQTPLKEHTTLPLTPSHEGLLALGNCSFGTRNLTCSHVLIGTQFLDLNSFPPGSLAQFLDSPLVHEVCGADELWIFL